MDIKNIGELRKMINDLPDEMPFRVYSGSVESYVFFSVGVDDEDGEIPAFVVWGEN